MKITKQDWRKLGGLRNPHCWRKMVSGRWYYYCDPEFAFTWSQNNA